MSTAQVRRLYHHKQHGGSLSLRDIGYCIEVCEGKDNEILQLQQQNEALKHDLDRALDASTKEATDLTACLQRQYETSSLMADQEAWIKRIEQQNQDMLGMLKEAKDMVSAWGEYADSYFQDKHGLDEDIKKIDTLIAKIEHGSEAEGK